jgi:His-Xaa-Ser system radical SAM maturase HxsB
MARQFFTIDKYGGNPSSYDLFPFRFMRLNGTQDILVNEVGEHIIADRGAVQTIVARQLDRKSPLYKSLKAKQFIYDSESDALKDVLAAKYRTKKSFLHGFTKLHIFVVTLRCDHSCHYCQVSRQTADRTTFDMSQQTAEKSLDLMMCSPSPNITLEFQGGEPLLAFDLIKFIVPRAREKAAAKDKHLDIVLVSNLSNLDDDILAYLKANNIRISTSLDGPAFLHNTNRPRPGNNSYELTIESINKARAVLGFNQVSAMMTTTLLSLDYPIEIIDEYVRHGFASIFLRPLSPYGFAVKSKHRTGYEIERFLSFYKKGLAHLLELNKRGVRIQEFYTTMLLTKILTPYATSYVDLQSPAGAATSVLVYNYDGGIFATDEARMLAEMQDNTFRLGTVHDTSYRDLVTGEAYRRLMAASVNEALPGCVDCAFQSYCGADPVYHHATQGDMFGHRPTSGFCHRNMEVLKHLFELLSNGDAETRRILLGWVSGSQRSADTVESLQ